MAAKVRPAEYAESNATEAPHTGTDTPHPLEGPTLQHPGDGGHHLRETLGSMYFLFCCILFVLVFLSLGRTKLHFRWVARLPASKHCKAFAVAW